MTIKMQWTCDGCDRTDVSPPSSIPYKWSRVMVEIKNDINPGVSVKPQTYDLCYDCQSKLFYNAQPKTWERKK